MIEFFVLFWNKVALLLGCAWAIKLSLYPITLWMHTVVLIGIPYLIRMFMNIGVKLVLLYARKHEEELALRTANLGIRLLQKSIERKENSKGGDAMIRALSKTLVRGVSALVRDEHESTVTTVLDNRMAEFASALQKGRFNQAESLAKVAITVLNSAMEEITSETKFTADYLSRAFIKCLHDSFAAQETLVKQIINKRAMEFSILARKNQRIPAKMLMRSIMTILKVAVTVKYLEILKMAAASTVTSLVRTIEEGRPEIVDEVLEESMAGIYVAVVESGGNYASAMATSGAIHALLVAAQEARSTRLIKVLSESWIQQWDRASRNDARCQQDVGRLIEERGAKLHDTIRSSNAEAKATWNVAFELLLATVVMDKVDLQEKLSISLVTNLSSANRRGDDGFVGSLMYNSGPALSEALAAGDDRRANAISNTGLQLLLTAINRKGDPLMKDMSEAWVATLDNLDKTNTSRRVTMDGLLEDVLTRPFTTLITGGNSAKAQEFSDVIIQLLLAAIRGEKPPSTRSLARCWIVGVTSVVDSYAPAVDRLIKSRTTQFAESIIASPTSNSPSETSEVQIQGIAAAELSMAARDEGNTTIVNKLANSWVEALANVIERQYRTKANDLLHKMRKQYFDKTFEVGDERLTSLIAKIAEVAREKNKAVEVLIKQEWEN